MAHTYRISGYFVDPNDLYRKYDIQATFDLMDGFFNGEIEQSEEYEFDDDVPENSEDCTPEQFEKRFSKED